MNTPIDIEFEDDFDKIGDFYTIRYRQTGMHFEGKFPKIYGIDKYEFDFVAKSRGWLHPDACLCFDMDYTGINHYIKILAKEDFNIKAVLALEKLERGYAELNEELKNAQAEAGGYMFYSECLENKIKHLESIIKNTKEIITVKSKA
jgi:hypothetical protein